MKIAHIINPVKVSTSSDLYVAQPVTFRTMLKAKADSAHRDNILQYVVGYEEDVSVFPEGFKVLPFLQRSIMDFGDFTKTRTLPLIHDILNSLTDVDADYLIYTNVDIALMPCFYDYVYDKLSSGSDSMIINRRVIGALQTDALMYADVGQPHPGYDCFVFRKALLPKFILGHTCIGANWIGRIMYCNLLVFSEQLEVIKDAHVSFHIGEDGAWLNAENSAFDVFNKSEVYSSIDALLSLTADDKTRALLEDVLKFMDDFDKPVPKKQQTPLSRKAYRMLKKEVKRIVKPKR